MDHLETTDTKFSVVIACHNEGPDLEATVALVRASTPRPHQIIVVDDQSAPPLAPRLAIWPDVEVYPTPSQMGAGRAKDFGASLVSNETDVIILLDSHMRMPADWLARIQQAYYSHPNSIFCTSCRDFVSGGKFLGAGARMDPRNRLRIGLQWNSRGDVEEVDTVPCIYGACYILPVHIWADLGGINPLYYGWGFEEQDLSVRTWMLGYEVRRINGLCVLHRFDRALEGTFLNSWQAGYNLLVTARTLAPDLTTRYVSHLQKIVPDQAFQLYCQNKDEIDDFADRVQNSRLMDEEAVEELCGFRPPTRKEASREADAIRKHEKRQRAKPTFWRSEPDVELPKEIRKIKVCGLRRSGNHGIIRWIASHFNGVHHINDLPINGHHYTYGDANNVECEILSYEDVWEPDCDLYIFRSFQNLIASRIRRIGYCPLATATKLWPRFAESFLDATYQEHSPTVALDFFSDHDRATTHALLNLPGPCQELPTDQSEIGDGSSFDAPGTELSMETLRDRWLQLESDKERKMFEDAWTPEIKRLNKKIFAWSFQGWPSLLTTE